MDFPWSPADCSLSDPPSEPSCSSQPVGPALAVVGNSALFETAKKGRLVGGDWNMTFIFPFSWECHHSN